MYHAFKYVYEHYIDKYDWFMRIDCGTCVVMENLRILFLDKDPNEHYYSGFNLTYKLSRLPKDFQYPRGRSYIKSSKTFSPLVTKGLGNKKYCKIRMIVLKT
uniref:Integrase catalytic domain-containing protein n=1 Tax=Strongyloides venezuelensis TaxID=75913 RepID=A0A0K0FPA0_STRVS